MSHDARHRYEWNTIPWRTLEVRVLKLQRRIYQATTRGETKKARRLQKLLASSWSAKSLAVRQVTQENKGKKTAGVDGIKSLTPPQRLQLISAIDLHTPVKPVRRIWIAKPGKTEQRPLGACPRINTHLSVGVGLSAWRSPLVLFCRLGYHLNTARGDVPDAIPTTQGLMERHVGGSDDLKPSARHVHSATA